MPTWRATAKSHVRETGHQRARLVAVGENFKSDEPPAISWAPVDAAARTAKAGWIKSNPDIVERQGIVSGGLRGPAFGHRDEVLSLAASLGGSGFESLDSARAFIRRWAAEN
jgi:hypothetical protein